MKPLKKAILKDGDLIKTASEIIIEIS